MKKLSSIHPSSSSYPVERPNLSSITWVYPSLFSGLELVKSNQGGVLGPPPLPLDAEEQHLYSEPLPDDRSRELWVPLNSFFFKSSSSHQE